MGLFILTFYLCLCLYSNVCGGWVGVCALLNCIDNSGWCHLYLVCYPPHLAMSFSLTLSHSLRFILNHVVLCMCNAIQTTNHMDPHINHTIFQCFNAKKFNIKQIRFMTYAWLIVILENGERRKRIMHARIWKKKLDNSG